MIAEVITMAIILFLGICIGIGLIVAIVYFGE